MSLLIYLVLATSPSNPVVPYSASSSSASSFSSKSLPFDRHVSSEDKIRPDGSRHHLHTYTEDAYPALLSQLPRRGAEARSKINIWDPLELLHHCTVFIII
ncbi:hypothetical protein HRR83_007157 [Exophiala dermatitidis]|uniref:Uncharacterized protein n=1 Tax=Exophiala dermatitidis TaxID=5970 RepID=A0AAN6EQG8_EXODE|nr:hypothetical protein HRR73_006449 [Exophiala dermatitidis]KAJ4511949.1 hypothetical protein HRR74_006683 [Exophiala dermatitidis]KAJ4534811.1 hypothetical protein HRR76_006719 [Exophiala dermatitidis]KAJ4550839.1 hypothetical protein HRR77_003198 [Exophiala dermatitidis]KAJ4562036.1 hypothetical protein HRR79_006898 [Exophiala dermatitidis]